MCEDALVAAASRGKRKPSPHFANLLRESLSRVRTASPEIVKTQRMHSKMRFLSAFHS